MGKTAEPVKVDPGSFSIKFTPQPRGPAGQEPHRCPVCDGRGIVLPGFYSFTQTLALVAHEECRSCSGSGVVWG